MTLKSASITLLGCDLENILNLIKYNYFIITFSIILKFLSSIMTVNYHLLFLRIFSQITCGNTEFNSKLCVLHKRSPLIYSQNIPFPHLKQEHSTFAMLEHLSAQLHFLHWNNLSHFKPSSHAWLQIFHSNTSSPINFDNFILSAFPMEVTQFKVSTVTQNTSCCLDNMVSIATVVAMVYVVNAHETLFLCTVCFQIKVPALNVVIYKIVYYHLF